MISTPDIAHAAELLAQYPTALVSDALDELGFVGAVPGLVPVRSNQTTVTGQALTVRFEPLDADPAAHRYGGGVGRPLEQVLRTMGAGQIVVMDLGATNSASAWGGLASRLAQRGGVHGTVMWGTCRDVEEIRELGYPVWSVGAHPRRSRGSFTFGTIGQPLDLAGVAVRTGDVIVGDGTGVVCVPRDLAARTAELAAGIQAAEDSLLDQISRDAVVNWDDV